MEQNLNKLDNFIVHYIFSKRNRPYAYMYIMWIIHTQKHTHVHLQYTNACIYSRHNV